MLRQSGARVKMKVLAQQDAYFRAASDETRRYHKLAPSVRPSVVVLSVIAIYR
jgi:hypothetical protein